MWVIRFVRTDHSGQTRGSLDFCVIYKEINELKVSKSYFWDTQRTIQSIKYKKNDNTCRITSVFLSST